MAGAGRSAVTRTILVALALAAIFGAALRNMGSSTDAACAALDAGGSRGACERRLAAAPGTDATLAPLAVKARQTPAPG